MKTLNGREITETEKKTKLIVIIKIFAKLCTSTINYSIQCCKEMLIISASLLNIQEPGTKLKLNREDSEKEGIVCLTE